MGVHVPSMTDFGQFFAELARHLPSGSGPPLEPFPYQAHLADPRRPWPVGLSVPTGCGKTLAVLTAWLWRRRNAPHTTPRRLVYALPMRVLVEQTADVARAVLGQAGVRVAALMGGEADEEWWLYPEQELVLVGTIDMLLSRALNRGYAASRYHWPVDFGLLNSDVLWVVDELQLMDAALYTTLQLQAFRHHLGTFGSTHTLWVSATLNPAWLHSIDHREPDPARILTLGDADLQHSRELARRLHAPKRLQRATLRRGRGSADRAEQVARFVLDQHRPGTLTLAVFNTVGRAVEAFRVARRLVEGNGRPGSPSSPDLRLLHSMFRPADRRAQVSWLTQAIDPDGPGRIAFCTQVIEAGVDVSAATLVTELAPWPSIVQRLGRCNRFGRDQDARVFWLDLGEREADPYEPDQLDEARELLLSLEGADASPLRLSSMPLKGHPASRSPVQVLRRRDLIGLFDTSADLSGQETDVSRFIRCGTDLDVFVFWRAWGKGEPPADMERPAQQELCPVPVYRFREFLEAGGEAWVWDPLAVDVRQRSDGEDSRGRRGRWRRLYGSELRPGLVLLVEAGSGGYSPLYGWDARLRDPVPTVSADPRQPRPTPDSADADHGTEAPRRWVTLDEHTRAVLDEVRRILNGLKELEVGPVARRALERAALFHDIGKAHGIFQTPLRRLRAEAGLDGTEQAIWAKAPALRHRARSPFRHELVSALAYLQVCRTLDPDSPTELHSLVAFLVAAHHGKIRLAIRSHPDEKAPPARARFAQGVWEGDPLRALVMPGLLELPHLHLSLEPMELGTPGDPELDSHGASWTERMLALRDAAEWGPFRLAFLEALLRAADARASTAAEATSERGE